MDQETLDLLAKASSYSNRNLNDPDLCSLLRIRPSICGG